MRLRDKLERGFPGSRDESLEFSVLRQRQALGPRPQTRIQSVAAATSPRPLDPRPQTRIQCVAAATSTSPGSRVWN
jgi:hypothetical protein